MNRDVLQQLQPLCFSKGVLVSWGGTPACVAVYWDASVYHHRVLGRQRVSSSCVVIASKQKDIVADLDKEIVEETLMRFVK